MKLSFKELNNLHFALCSTNNNEKYFLNSWYFSMKIGDLLRNEKNTETIFDLDFSENEFNCLEDRLDYCSKNFSKAFNNPIFYEDNSKLVHSIMETLKNVVMSRKVMSNENQKSVSIEKCEHDFEEVAFNTDLEDGTELYDCVCKKCGKHAILNIDKD